MYPAALALSTVLIAQTEIGISLAAVARSTVTVVVVAILLTALLSLLFRDVAIGGIAAGASILVLRSGGVTPGLTALLLAGLCAVAVVWTSRRARTGWRERGTGVLNAVGAALLVVGIGGSVFAEVSSIASVPPSTAPALQPATGLPDIHVLLLDAYPRADALERTLGVSNDDFLAQLEARGLEIADDARSNFMYTAPSLVSLFDLGQMGAVGRSIRTERHALRPSDLINRGPALDLLRQAGYETYAGVARWERETLRMADHLCGTEPINEFEFHMIRASLIGRVLDVTAPGWMAARDRSIVNAEFACGREAAAADAGDAPKFAFTHVGSPHNPVIFNRDGGPAPQYAYLDPLEIFPSERPRVDEAYLDQQVYVHQEALRVVDAILANAKEPPVIILMSDHGSWFRIGTDYDETSDLRERFSTLFAASTPGRQHLFPDSVSIGQILPILFNAYLGTEIEVPESRYFFSRTADIFELTEIPDPFEAVAPGN